MWYLHIEVNAGNKNIVNMKLLIDLKVKTNRLPDMP